MEKNKERKIRRAVEELFGKGNTEIIEEIFSTDYIAHSGKKEYRGHSFIKQFVKLLRTSIPDIRIVDIKFLAQNGNTIVWKRTMEGTHKAKMRGIPPSGQTVKWADMIVTRFKDEKIAEEWVVSELMGELLLKVSRIQNNGP